MQAEDELLLDQFNELIKNFRESKYMKNIKDFIHENMDNEVKIVKEQYKKHKNEIKEEDRLFLYERFYDLGYILDDKVCDCKQKEGENYKCEYCGRKCHCIFPSEDTNFMCCGFCSPCLCEELNEQNKKNEFI